MAMAVTYHVSATFPATAAAAYAAWLDSAGHTEMTGATAVLDARVGGTHSAWDGYVSGTIVALEPGRRIVMRWRTLNFGANDGDSTVIVTFEDVADGVRVDIAHTEIPDGQPDYGQGWHEHYFEPMAVYFGS